jgi:hypothetical protein
MDRIGSTWDEKLKHNFTNLKDAHHLGDTT